MTLAEYINGKIAIEIPQNTIDSICYDRKVTSSNDCLDIEDRIIQLCLADAYMHCVTLPSIKSSDENSHGDWKSKSAGYEMSVEDKRNFKNLANSIYQNYGEESKGKKTIKIVNL